MDQKSSSPDEIAEQAQRERRKSLAAAAGPDWERAAMAAPCEFEGCSGRGHDNSPDPAEWRHEVVAETWDRGIVQAEISVFSDKPPVGSISFEGDGEMTAAEFRQAAEDYEEFPAWLRSMADRMDALST